MSADACHTANTPTSLFHSDISHGLLRIREMLMSRGEPLYSEESTHVNELAEYFSRAMLRLFATSFTLNKGHELPESDRRILDFDVQLVNEIGSLLLNTLGR